MIYLIDVNNCTFLENLEYQISLKENTYKNFKRIPVFTEQIKKFDKTVINLEEEFEKIRLRDKYKIIIADLDSIINSAK